MFVFEFIIYFPHELDVLLASILCHIEGSYQRGHREETERKLVIVLYAFKKKLLHKRPTVATQLINPKWSPIHYWYHYFNIFVFCPLSVISNIIQQIQNHHTQIQYWNWTQNWTAQKNKIQVAFKNSSRITDQESQTTIKSLFKKAMSSTGT